MFVSRQGRSHFSIELRWGAPTFRYGVLYRKVVWFVVVLLGLRQVIAAEIDPGAVGEILVKSYPTFLSRVDGGTVIWRDGTRMPLSDGNREKTFEERLEHPDLTDMFAQPYAPGPPVSIPDVNEDPGRFRNEAFFTRMYGDCRKGEVAPRLRAVRWMPNRGGGTVMVTTVNGVADRLENVVRDLERLPKRMTSFLVPSAGAYACRAIAGTTERSMHAYGAAIDINSGRSEYWRWPEVPKGAIHYRNSVPFEIVKIFERHGFIGAESGIISILCILSTGQNYSCHPRLP
jgi:hypothetical protein